MYALLMKCGIIIDIIQKLPLYIEKSLDVEINTAFEIKETWAYFDNQRTIII